MQNLVVIKKQNKIEIPVTTSKVIAEGSKNTHDSIQKMLSRYESDFLEFGKLGFEIRPSEKNQNEKIYFLNENQTLLLITYMRNNEVVRKLKVALVKEFSEMKNLLNQKASEEWQLARKSGKQFQIQLNDTILDFVNYAKSQGSSSPERYFTLFAKLSNTIMGIKSGERDFINSNKVMMLNLIIQTIKQQIRFGMSNNIPYKEIYQICKERANEIHTQIYPLLSEAN
jgi:phage regulator Rha-like protein